MKDADCWARHGWTWVWVFLTEQLDLHREFLVVFLRDSGVLGSEVRERSGSLSGYLFWYLM